MRYDFLRDEFHLPVGVLLVLGEERQHEVMHARVDTIVDALDAVLGGAGQRQRLGDILGAALKAKN